MLERFFKYPGVLRRMRQGPLATEIDAIADALDRAGYAHLSARRYLSLIASFSRYAARAGYRRAQAIDRLVVKRFVRQRAFSAATMSVARTALGHVLRHVATRDHQPLRRSRAERRDARFVAGLDNYLCDLRGLAPKSREEIMRAARRTLAWYHAASPHRPLARFSAKDVLAYAEHAARRAACDRTRSAAMSHLRDFLRYLHWSGIGRADLSRVVPRVPMWSLARIPEALPWADVRRLIISIDHSTPVGKRDRALIMLAATTGLRNAELRRLELGDIHWHAGEVHVRRTKNRRERVVPLVADAGRALADYVLHGRPQTTARQVFLSHQPPVRPLTVSGTVSCIVRRRLTELGLCPDRAGTHLLRHSLATQMVRGACPIKDVADLLGHQTIDTTAIYVKVAVPQLATVALPFPGGAA
jgi:site-specific recombinase XerD